jgi:hypothetical protein
MGDEISAPVPEAPPAAPASVNETPINPNPPSSPNPIGSQAPQATPSRREAIKAAFDRATAQQDGKTNAREIRGKPAGDPPKAAEAKKGHNKPPEPVGDEQPKLDLKKRPGDQPRGERGQFAPRTPDHGPAAPTGIEQGVKGTTGTSPPSSIHTLPENAPFRDPPPRMAEHAKAEWAAAPESVRGEIHRMHQEFGNAYNQLKPMADAFQPVARFHQMAQQHGTTLERALDNYTSIEAKLRDDVVGGLDVIVNNLRLTDPQTNQRIGLRDIAYHVLSQTPEALQQIQMGNSQHAASQQIGALHAKVDGLENMLQQWQTAQQFTYTRAQVDQFADRHPRFDELGALIKTELDFGFDLETAYRRAELLQPATQAPQTRTPAAQTRTPADRSISGSPSVSGSSPASRRNEKPVGRREAIANAIKRVNGGM